MTKDATKVWPKDFFFHIGVIAALYATVFSFISLVFSIINFALPDTSSYYSQTFSYSVPVGTLIVVFPILLILSWLLNKQYESIPEKKNIWLRKWLLDATLFIAGAVIAVDLIVLLISFLNGEFITLNFILKVITVFIVAGMVFGYYILDIKNRMTPKRSRMSVIVAGIIIVAFIVMAFSIMGSPRTQRLIRIDQNKVNDLNNIQWQIVNYWQQKQILPQNLEALEDPISGFIVPMDPQTGESYGYEVTGRLSFELCAEFNLNRSSNDSTAPRMPVEPYFNKGEDLGPWSHEDGYYCFERTIDPELYKPIVR